MIVENIALYVADKILGPLVEKTWKTKIKSWIYPSDSYKIKLAQIIQQTIKEFEAIHPVDKDSNKYPFYHSQELFEKLSSFVLYQNGSIEKIQLDFNTNPQISSPQKNELDEFYILFLDNVNKDEKLKALFIDENYKAQIFENTGRLNAVLVGLISIKKDTIELNQKASKIIKLVEDGNNIQFPKELSTVLPKLNKNKIVGRSNDLKDLKKRLFDNKQVVLMNGMGGIGKTTLAMVYLTEYYEAYNHILWVTSTTNDFINDFVSTSGLLESLKLDYNENAQKTYHSIIARLKSLPGKCLLIIDNATEKLAEHHTKLPGQPNWHLMVTSRDEIPFFELKELGFLSET